MTRAVTGPRRRSKALPKPNLYQNMSLSLFGGLLPADHYSFLNLGKTIISERHAQQTHEMHQKLQQVQPALVNRMGPILLHDNAQKYVAQPMLQKLNWAVKFCFASSTIFTQPLAN